MSKQEEIIEVEGKDVEVRYSNNSTDCCGRCAFWANTCTVEDDMMRIPCREYDKNGKYAYFVLAKRPKPTIIAQKSPANNTEADLNAEIERWWDERYAKLKKDYKFAQMSGHYLDNETIIDLARHFVEWGVKRFREQIAAELAKFKWDPMKHLKK